MARTPTECEVWQFYPPDVGNPPEAMPVVSRGDVGLTRVILYTSKASIANPTPTTKGRALDIHRLIVLVISRVLAGETLTTLISAGMSDLHKIQSSTKPVNGEKCRADQVLLRQIPIRYQNRAPSPFEDSSNFDLVQFASEFGFLLFDVGPYVFRQFCNDVVPLHLGQPEFDCLQVAIQKIHAVPP